MSIETRLQEEEIKKTLEKIQNLESHIGEPQYNLSHQEQVKINIRVDKSVPAAMFKPDPKLPGGWIANELTFKAMKKDIFALDDELIDLEQKYNCLSCKKDIDKQFWSFCPHCGAQFSKIII